MPAVCSPTIMRLVRALLPCVKSKSVAKRCYLEASALAKRYVVERGTFVVNHLFRRVTRDDMMCLTLGMLEVIAIFVRKKNASVVPHTAFNQAMTDFRSEAIDAANLTKIPVTDSLINAVLPLSKTLSQCHRCCHIAFRFRPRHCTARHWR